MEELFREDGAGHLSLGRGELVVAVEVPRQRLEDRLRQGTHPRRRRFSARGVAVALRRDGDRVAGLKVAITGTNSALLRAHGRAVGGRWDAAAAETLSQLVRKTSNVLKTTVTGVGYRRRVLLALAPRTVDALWQGG